MTMNDRRLASRLLVTLAAASVLGACVTLPATEVLAPYHGRSVTALVVAIGYPTATIAYLDGVTLYVWERSGNFNLTLPSTNTTYHTGTVYDQQTFNSYTYTGQSTTHGTRTTTYNYRCRLVAEVDGETDKMRRVTSEGNGCGRYMRALDAATKAEAEQ